MDTEPVPQFVKLEKNRYVTFHYGNEPAHVRGLVPHKREDLQGLIDISLWEPAAEQIDFPSKREMTKWLNEGNRSVPYDERSFLVTKPDGEMQGFINFYPTPPEFIDEVVSQLELPPADPDTLDLYIVYSKHPDNHNPGLMASGLRQACLQISQAVDLVKSQQLLVDGKSNPVKDLRVTAIINSWNTASIKVAEEAGFVSLGTLPHENVLCDPPEEVLVFVLDKKSLDSKLMHLPAAASNS